MSRMFKSVDETWNPFVGCLFNCIYCWARKIMAPRLKRFPQYQDFYPKLVEKELKRKFKPGKFVGVSLMGDIAFAAPQEFAAIIEVERSFPDTTFLNQTKDPGVFKRMINLYGDDIYPYPDNVYLGTTIETNFNFEVSRAPAPQERYKAIMELPHPHKFISIEPLMDFHLATLVGWMRDIKPEIIEIGADNYNNNLEEPHGKAKEIKSPWKVKVLVEYLKEICPVVIEKQGLERLKGG